MFYLFLSILIYQEACRTKNDDLISQAFGRYVGGLDKTLQTQATRCFALVEWIWLKSTLDQNSWFDGVSSADLACFFNFVDIYFVFPPDEQGPV